MSRISRKERQAKNRHRPVRSGGRPSAADVIARSAQDLKLVASERRDGELLAVVEKVPSDYGFAVLPDGQRIFFHRDRGRSTRWDALARGKIIGISGIAPATERGKRSTAIAWRLVTHNPIALDARPHDLIVWRGDGVLEALAILHRVRALAAMTSLKFLAFIKLVPFGAELVKDYAREKASYEASGATRPFTLQHYVLRVFRRRETLETLAGPIGCRLPLEARLHLLEALHNFAGANRLPLSMEDLAGFHFQDPEASKPLSAVMCKPCPRTDCPLHPQHTARVAAHSSAA